MTWEGVIDFWFNQCSPEQWFTRDDLFDEVIRSKFLQTYDDVLTRKTLKWKEVPEGALAEVIVLDQFARNMFRGTPQAFKGDALALRLAQDAVARGDDMSLSEEHRYFLYMPYMHSESKEVHEEAVELFSRLQDKNGLKYEKMHKDIIDQFGRYPHRNAILGRPSTPAEEEFLKTQKGF